MFLQELLFCYTKNFFSWEVGMLLYCIQEIHFSFIVFHLAFTDHIQLITVMIILFY